MSDVVVLVGNPKPGSRTRLLAEAAARALGEPSPLVLELAEIVGVTFGPEPAFGRGEGDPFGSVRSARLLIVATPTYKGTYTGLLKIFLDQFGPGALAGVVAVPVTVAASDAHLRAASAALRDLLVELGASVPAPALAALEPALADADGVAAAWAAEAPVIGASLT
jgi:FMN reductase